VLDKLDAKFGRGAKVAVFLRTKLIRVDFSAGAPANWVSEREMRNAR
jgi:hypothetical protein